MFRCSAMFSSRWQSGKRLGLDKSLEEPQQAAESELATDKPKI
jgi:hypothetical protein